MELSNSINRNHRIIEQWEQWDYIKLELKKSLEPME